MIRIAIIGAGAISRSHIRAYMKFPEKCKIVAITDIYADKAKERAEEFGLDAALYDNYGDALEQSGADAVSVCTPPYTHAEIAIAALNAGKHVLAEKPMASSLEECDAMIEASARSGRVLSVIAQSRFKTENAKLKRILESGIAGPILHTQIDSFWWRGYSYYDLWWRGTWEKEGGGCTLNHAVHHIDLCQWLIGMPAEVSAVMSNLAHDNAEVEDLSIALLRYDRGTMAQITSSVVHHGEEQQLVFQGKHARVSTPWRVAAATARENGFPEQNEELEREIQAEYDNIPALEHEGHAGQVMDFLTAVEGDGKVLIDGEQGRNTLEIITAIYASASTGETVRLPLPRDHPFYTRDGMLRRAKHFHEKKNSVENFKMTEIKT